MFDNCWNGPCYCPRCEKEFSDYLKGLPDPESRFGLDDLSRLTLPRAREKGLRAALKLIRAKTAKAKTLNAIAAKVVAEMGGIATDDLFALMEPLDRELNWRDTYHFKPDSIARQVKQVAASCLSALPD